MIVAILGAGPAGLLAAEAVEQRGHKAAIFSRKVKSEMFGAMFLHSRIPGITSVDPELLIDVIKSGTREGYAQNVYGDTNHPVSWDKFSEGTIPGWDLKKAYDKLWTSFSPQINEADVNSQNIGDLIKNFERVYCSIPAQSLCVDETHEFKQQNIWIVHGEGGLIPGVNDMDLMYYNGHPPDGSVAGTVGPEWYRYSQINGYRCWEYRHHPGDAGATDVFSLSEGFKPISTTCDCWLWGMKRIGRFGKFEKQVLTHHTYHEVYDGVTRAL